MSSYIQKSQFISKFHYETNKDKYKNYEKYILEDKIIISKNEEPFVSIYDIAFYCKNKFKKNNLFLIAHRFIDKNTNEKLVEFFIFNTKNIFDKALTSYISIRYEELFEKRHLVQEMIKLAQKLLDVDDLFVILGDNVKRHDILEYLNIEEFYDIEDDSEKKVDLLKINKKQKPRVEFERISKVLNKVRILEPKERKNKKIFYMVIVLFVTLFFAGDIVTLLFEDYKLENKSKLKNDKNLLRKLDNDIYVKLNESRTLKNQTANYASKKIFKASSK